MYIKDRFHQFALSDFNQPIGLNMNPNNRWVKKAQKIPWFAIEDKYADLFPSKTGMPAKPLRMALGSLIIQKQYEYSDRELVEQLTENRTISSSLGFRDTSRSHHLFHRFWLNSGNGLPLRYLVRSTK